MLSALLAAACNALVSALQRKAARKQRAEENLLVVVVQAAAAAATAVMVLSRSPLLSGGTDQDGNASPVSEDETEATHSRGR